MVNTPLVFSQVDSFFHKYLKKNCIIRFTLKLCSCFHSCQVDILTRVENRLRKKYEGDHRQHLPWFLLYLHFLSQCQGLECPHRCHYPCQPPQGSPTLPRAWDPMSAPGDVSPSNAIAPTSPLPSSHGPRVGQALAARHSGSWILSLHVLLVLNLAISSIYIVFC